MINPTKRSGTKRNAPFGILTDCQKEETENDDEACLRLVLLLLIVRWLAARFINDADDCNILLDMMGVAVFFNRIEGEEVRSTTCRVMYICIRKT